MEISRETPCLFNRLRPEARQGLCTMDAPEVSVDPFSALTPGVLREVVRRWRGESGAN